MVPIIFFVLVVKKVDELRTLLRAPDLMLVHQRVRHVKESVVIREQRYALARSDEKFSEKLAKLFGWASSTGCSESPLHLTPIHSPVGDGHRSRDGSRRDGYASMTDNGTCSQVLRVRVEDTSINVTHEKQTFMADNKPSCSIDPRDDSGSAVDLEARKIPTEVEAAVMAVHPAPRITCMSCLELHVKLQAALTDRTLAETELMYLRKSHTSKDSSPREDNTDSFRDECAHWSMGSLEMRPPGTVTGQEDSQGLELGKELNRLEMLTVLGGRRQRKAALGMPDMDLPTGGCSVEDLKVKEFIAMRYRFYLDLYLCVPGDMSSMQSLHK